jgi:hypothetical protein
VHPPGLVWPAQSLAELAEQGEHQTGGQDALLVELCAQRSSFAGLGDQEAAAVRLAAEIEDAGQVRARLS